LIRVDSNQSSATGIFARANANAPILCYSLTIELKHLARGENAVLNGESRNKKKKKKEDAVAIVFSSASNHPRLPSRIPLQKSQSIQSIRGLDRPADKFPLPPPEVILKGCTVPRGHNGRIVVSSSHPPVSGFLRRKLVEFLIIRPISGEHDQESFQGILFGSSEKSASGINLEIFVGTRFD